MDVWCIVMDPIAPRAAAARRSSAGSADSRRTASVTRSTTCANFDRSSLPVQRRRADAHAGGDLLHRRPVVTALTEDPARRLDDELRTEPELVLPALTVDGGPGLIAMREYLARSFERFQLDAGLPCPDPNPSAELMVRIVVSFLLNPTSCIDLADDEAVRSFARRFLAPLLQY